MKIGVLQSPLRAQPSQSRLSYKVPCLKRLCDLTMPVQGPRHIRGQDPVHGHMGVRTKYTVVWGQDRVHGHMGSGLSTQAYGR